MARNPSDGSTGVARRRTFLKGTGALLAGAGLAGCSGGEGASTGGSSGSEGTVELEFWHIFGSELGGHLNDIVDEFNAMDNGVQVNTTSQGGYTESFQTTMSSLNAGNPPHIAQFSTAEGVAAMDSGQFIPVSELLGDRVDFEDRFMESVIDYFNLPGDDRYFSMPMNNSTAIMNYNKDMFAEAGLDPENPPQTFAEVRQVSETLVEETQAQEGCAWANVGWFIDQWHGWDESFLFNKRNGRDDPENGPTEINFDQETARQTYNWWNDMHDDGLYMATQQGWGDASGAALQSWRVGITLGSTAGLGRTAKIAREAEQPFELGAAPLFSPNEDRHGCRIGGGSLWVPEAAVSSTAEEEAVIDFFDWITGPEPQAQWHKRTGYFPINKESRKTLEDEGFFEENPAWTAGFDSLEESETSAHTRLSIVPQAPDIADLRADTWTEMRQGREPDAVLEEYKTQIDSVLQDN